MHVPATLAPCSAYGYTKDKKTGTCVACAEGCRTCDTAGAGRCDLDGCVFDNGWGSAPNGTCARCPANCTMCNSSAECTLCNSGFQPWKGACRSCGANCDLCTFGEAGQPQCDMCGSGGLDPVTKACTPCKQPNCLNW